MDWTQIMQDLYQRGYSAHRVSVSLRVSHCTADNWLKGGEPGWGKGKALLALHIAVCGESLTSSRVFQAEQRGKVVPACEESPSSSFVYGRL
jgi:hypothetical protein